METTDTMQTNDTMDAIEIMPKTIVTANHLTKCFGENCAIDDLSFNLQGGRITGLLGPNGSGKTTLLKLCNGLLKPDSGEILINGIAPGIESKKFISYLPERTYLNKWMKINDLLDFFTDFYTDFDKVKALEMLKALGLDKKTRLKTLSKGNREKVQLVLVMSRNAGLYLLDEPIGGVDPAARDYILKTILSNYQDNAAILLSTHLIQDVEHIFDDCIFLANGKINLQGSVDDIREEHGKSLDTLFREVFRC